MARAWPLLTVLLVVGCGGPGNLSRDTSVKCMRLHGVQVSTDAERLDTIARRAGGGALRAQVGGDTAIVAFERSEGDERRTEAAYRRGLTAADKPVKYLLRRNRNAVVVWDRNPGDDSRPAVEDCLVSP